MGNGMLSKYNLTEGSILERLFLVALPMVGTQIVQMAYNLIDMIWLGRVGSDAVAASGTAGLFMFMSMSLMAYGRTGSEIGVSQNLGQGEIKTAREYGQTAALINIFLGLLLGLLFIVFRGQLIGFFRLGDIALIKSTENYLAIVSFGFPVVFLSASVTGIYNGSGNSRIPFITNLIGLAINMILDPLLIFCAGWGVEGAAWATTIAQVVAGIVSAWAIIAYKNRPFDKFRLFAKPNWQYAKKITKWVAPIAADTFLFSFFSMLITAMVAAYGAGALAAQRIGLQVESLSWLIASGFCTALISFVGQNYGAGKWSRIHKSFKIGSQLMIIWGVIVTVLLFFGAEFIFKIFLPHEADVIYLGVINLRILSISQIASCLEGISLGSFRGLGRTIPPSIVIITSCFLRVVAAYFLSKTSLGLYGIWIAVTAGAVFRGVWEYTWYYLYSRKLPKFDTIREDPVLAGE